MVSGKGMSAGAIQLVLPAGVPLLHPESQVFEGMLAGWRNQMLARNLAASTIDSSLRHVRAFQAHADVYPWSWTCAMSDEWFADLRGVHHIANSTVRSYQVAVRGFCRFITDPAYGWAEECERRFGTHPIQVINEVNAAAHVADNEAVPRKRAFTRKSCKPCSTTPMTRSKHAALWAGRAGCRRSVTPLC